jgi:hypothetical protein
MRYTDYLSVKQTISLLPFSYLLKWYIVSKTIMDGEGASFGGPNERPLPE